MKCRFCEVDHPMATRKHRPCRYPGCNLPKREGFATCVTHERQEGDVIAYLAGLITDLEHETVVVEFHTDGVKREIP